MDFHLNLYTNKLGVMIGILTSCPVLPGGPEGPEGPDSPWRNEIVMKTHGMTQNNEAAHWQHLCHDMIISLITQRGLNAQAAKQRAVGSPSVQGSQYGRFSLWIPEGTHQRELDWYRIKIHKVDAGKEQADVSLKSQTPARTQTEMQSESEKLNQKRSWRRHVSVSELKMQRY